ncbi:MAG: wax ester/triacylglycerol synthase family O-acyltransferase [Myxococcales bacterium]|nr:wax ester/triacylglycerol synthase family O-acyltransferase [Myxococcales bacterium]MDH3484400.1 wax ester/triacylglycerol synthase family O-acyltransferase [Myxococcales bacterium]
MTTEPFCERLSALDATFLDIESKAAPMHVGAALLFDAKPLQLEHGGLDFERLNRFTEAALDSIPRYRQRVEWVPGLQHPVWIDDDRFNMRFHLRHTRLPLPGDERTLKRLVGRLFSQHLDRSRPLWEFWAVEGVENDTFALIIKAHHCMVDGVAGVQLLEALLQVTPDAAVREPADWQARPAPSRARLLRDEVTHRIDGMRKLAGYAPRVRENLRGLQNVLRSGLKPTPRTPFTEHDISPYRRFDWTSFDLDEVKAVKKALGGTVNDVVVTATTGAVRRFLQRRNKDVDAIEGFRTVLPVNTRKSVGLSVGNHVAMLLADLPVSEPDPLRRLEKVIRVTTALKHESNQTGGTELIEDVADLTTKRIVSELFRTAMRIRTYNLIITNVPGPPFPLYMLGAPLKAIYPMVPLMQNQNLGIALFSYCGALYWGFNADWESFPDVHEFVEDLEAAFDELKALARARPPEARSAADAQKTSART